MFVQRTKVLQISLLAIFSAFLVELIFGLISNSLALVTDSIHALLDSVVTIVLLLAARMAIKPPDAEHTYGHGKIESLGGLLGGIAIFLIACFFVYESLTRLQNPGTKCFTRITCNSWRNLHNRNRYFSTNNTKKINKEDWRCNS